MRKTISVAIFLILVSFQASADQITLKNGDRLTGQDCVLLTEQLFFFPNLTRGGEYRINFDSGLSADITRRIGWQVTLSDRYLSNPPPGLERNDLLLSTGLKIKLGGSN
jgi:Protein of unknown function, DUF481